MRGKQAQDSPGSQVQLARAAASRDDEGNVDGFVSSLVRRRRCDRAQRFQRARSEGGGDQLGEGEGDVAARGARAWPTDWTGLERR